MKLGEKVRRVRTRKVLNVNVRKTIVKKANHLTVARAQVVDRVKKAKRIMTSNVNAQKSIRVTKVKSLTISQINIVRIGKAKRAMKIEGSRK